MRNKRFLLICFSLLLALKSQGQFNPPSEPEDVYITITDTTIISSISPSGEPVFTDPNINYFLTHHIVTKFRQAYPDSRFPDFRKIYAKKIKKTGSPLGQIYLPELLKTYYPQYFPHYEGEDAVPELAYTPDDFPNISSIRRTDYLKYINAEQAWDISTGNPSVVIGISDTYIYDTHPDLRDNITRVSKNVLPDTNKDHGTMITGMAVARTDNNLGYPAIGFNCTVDFSSDWGGRGDSALLFMSREKLDC